MMKQSSHGMAKFWDGFEHKVADGYVDACLMVASKMLS